MGQEKASSQGRWILEVSQSYRSLLKMTTLGFCSRYLYFVNYIFDSRAPESFKDEEQVPPLILIQIRTDFPENEKKTLQLSSCREECLLVSAKPFFSSMPLPKTKNIRILTNNGKLSKKIPSLF